MTPTKFQLKKLERALERAAKLSTIHAEAVRVVEDIFTETFGVNVPEESFSISGGIPTNEVGSLFNNFVNHGEDMAGNTTASIVARMAELMATVEDE